MSNTLATATIFQAALDEQVMVEATSGWMEANAGQVQYNGGAEIKVPRMSTDGLADYDREEGFVQGSVNLSYQTLTLTQDRAKTFSLDAMDIDETNFVANATAVMADFQRANVIPEVDAYRYSKLAAEAITKGKAGGGYVPDADTILAKLQYDIAQVQDLVGDIPLVITMATPVASLLSSTKDINRFLDAVDFKKGEISTKVMAIDGMPIIRVPSSRLKTAYLFKDGKATDQTTGGFAPTAEAKNINWLITARTAPIGISKTDIIRIFDPMTNQKANAWKIDYRKFHDLFVLDNKWNTVWANIREALA